MMRLFDGAKTVGEDHVDLRLSHHIAQRNRSQLLRMPEGVLGYDGTYLGLKGVQIVDLSGMYDVTQLEMTAGFTTLTYGTAATCVFSLPRVRSSRAFARPAHSLVRRVCSSRASSLPRPNQKNAVFVLSLVCACACACVCVHVCVCV